MKQIIKGEITMNIKTILTIAAVLVVLGAGIAVARPAANDGGFWNGMMGGLNNGINGIMGYGMMGQGNGYGGMMGQANGYGGMMGQANGYGGMMGQANGYGGMMGQANGYGGMMGQGNGYGGMMGQANGYGGMMGQANGYGGMMGPGTGNGTTSGCGLSGTAGISNDAAPITIEQAKDSVEKYLATTGNTDIVLTEVLEFDNNFYAGVKEKSTGTHAFELLVNKYTGAVVPEMGPNMMWNTKYGHMTLNTQESSTVTEKQAIEIAQKYLDTELPGTEVEDADTFYGYYTLEVKKDDKLYGMLSVNANTGAVWYHNWHGTFIKILEVK